MPKPASSDSVIFNSDSGASEFQPEANDDGQYKKRRRVAGSRSKKDQPALIDASSLDIEDAATFIDRPHGADYHDVKDIAALQEELLDWFNGIRSVPNQGNLIHGLIHPREKRGMPWRKKYDPDCSMEEKGQRAYEVRSTPTRLS